MLDIKINKNSPTPTYYQIQKQIRNKIENEEIALGEKLPSERKLSQKINVSRDTIRKAVKNLIAEGYCSKKVGKGIYVSKEKIPFNITNLRGTTSYINKLGLELKTEMIANEIQFPDKLLKSKLNINKKDNVLYLKRIRNINNQPLIMEESFLPLNLFPGLNNMDFLDSLYKILNEKYNTFPDRSKGEINFKLASEAEANFLNVKLNAALLRRKSTVYTKDDLPIEYCVLTCRSDKFNFLYSSNSN